MSESSSADSMGVNRPYYVRYNIRDCLVKSLITLSYINVPYDFEARFIRLDTIHFFFAKIIIHLFLNCIRHLQHVIFFYLGE